MAELIMKRYPGNPIITLEDFPLPAHAVFNCGQTMFEGKYLLLLPAIYQGKTPGHHTGIHIATSEDGVHFDINPEQFIGPLDWADEGDPDFLHDRWVIDPRVTKIGDTYYICRPGQGSDGPCALLEKTKDFKTKEFIDCIALPSNRVPCLFPEKINGLYYKIDRPYNHLSEKIPFDGKRNTNCAGMWVSSSPDLVNWGHYRPICLPEMPFANFKMGPTPPYKTKDGWLVIIHGVIKEGVPFMYQIGAMLLDLENPQKILGMTKTPILKPEEEYELHGRVDNVVFPCGFIVNEEKDELRIYYGAADTCIGLATGKLSDIIDACKKNL